MAAIRISRKGLESTAVVRGRRVLPDYPVRRGARETGFVHPTLAGYWRAYCYERHMGDGPFFSVQSAARFALGRS